MKTMFERLPAWFGGAFDGMACPATTYGNFITMVDRQLSMSALPTARAWIPRFANLHKLWIDLR
jgi:hypothetical protein